MICPHCEYEHGYGDGRHDDGSYKKVIGSEGDFYRLPITLTRDGDNYHGIDETAGLYGCPACNKTFIQET